MYIYGLRLCRRPLFLRIRFYRIWHLGRFAMCNGAKESSPFLIPLAGKWFLPFLVGCLFLRHLAGRVFPHPVSDRFFRSSDCFASVFASSGLQALFALSGWPVGFAPSGWQVFFSIAWLATPSALARISVASIVGQRLFPALPDRHFCLAPSGKHFFCNS